MTSCDPRTNPQGDNSHSVIYGRPFRVVGLNENGVDVIDEIRKLRWSDSALQLKRKGRVELGNVGWGYGVVSFDSVFRCGRGDQGE